MKEEKKPFFSVIVPVYNKEPHISRSINSILNQTFADFELIIVCDPSTDNSNAEVAKFTDPRIRVFHRDEPGPGGYAARNLGIKNAKADWIAFLDADDEWYPEHLTEMKNLSLSYPEANVMACAREIVENGKARLDKFTEAVGHENKIFTNLEYLKYSTKYEHPFHPNVVKIKRSFAQSNFSFPEGRTNRSGDLFAWVKLSCIAKNFAWSPSVGSRLYKDVVGVSKSNVPKMSLNHEMVSDLRVDCTPEEFLWLKKYANRLIRTAFFEQKKMNGKVEMGLLNAFYWRNDIAFCMFWLGLSLLPMQVITVLRKLKKALNEYKIWF